MLTQTAPAWTQIFAVCRLILASLSLFVTVQPPIQAQSTDWSKVHADQTTVKSSWPPAKSSAVWSGDLEAALTSAQRENRPLFLVFACPSPTPISSLASGVKSGIGPLEKLLPQFSLVELTDIAGVNLAALPLDQHQDLDNAWWGLVISPQGELLTTIGGRDAASPTDRLSIQGIASSLARALDIFYHPNRQQWNLQLPQLSLSAPKRSVKDLESFDSWQQKRARAANDEADSCVRCHHLAEINRQAAVDAGTFSAPQDWWVWPSPKKLGIHLDREIPLTIEESDSFSAAQASGLLRGDLLIAANDRPLLSEADLRSELHRLSATTTELQLTWIRQGKIESGTIVLGGDWKSTELDWRESVVFGNVGCDPGFFPLKASEDQIRRLKIPPNTLSIVPFVGQFQTSPIRDAGVNANDVVVSINGESPNLIGRPFLVWFRSKFKPGQSITLTTIKPNGKKEDITYTLSK